MSAPDVSILIVSWNVCAYLRGCLESIYRDPPRCDFEIVVVDNASKDETLAMLRSEFPQVQVIAHPENLGFARGNNLALQSARGKYILMLNPDTLVYPGAIDALVQALEANPRLGGCGSRYLNPDQSLQPSCYPMPTLFREFCRMFHLDLLWPVGVYNMRRWPLDQPRRVDVLQGASFLLRRDLLDQIGFLDPAYFMYTEEVDLCYRILKSGWELSWVPQSTIVHYGGQSTSQIAAKMFDQLYRTKVRFFRKHHGAAAALLYKTILAAATLPRLIGLPFRWILQKNQRPALGALMRNYSDLLGSLPEM